MKFSGKVWRHIPAGTYPLDTGWILRAAGRWNRAGEYGCLYTSLTRAGAIAEYYKYMKLANIPEKSWRPRETASLFVEVEPVVDLTDRKSSPIPQEAPFLAGDDPGDIEECRALADILRAQAYAGIITPSAASASQKNLIIYIDGPARNLKLEVGSDRLRI